MTMRTLAGLEAYLLRIGDTASSIVILVACVLATVPPAFRATRIDPIAALRRD